LYRGREARSTSRGGTEILPVSNASLDLWLSVYHIDMAKVCRGGRVDRLGDKIEWDDPLGLGSAV
jgi:hypothetical protein